MNLLESFYFIFDADMSGVKKQLKESDKATSDFTKSLDGADKTTQKVGAAFIDLAKKATAAVASVAALGAIKKLTFDTADATFEIRQQAAALTISTEKLTAWQHAVIASGGTAQGATSALTGLRDKFVEIATMGGGMGPDGFMLNKLGLSRDDMQKGITDPTAALEKLSDTFSSLNKIQQQFVGKRLGFDQGTIALLSQGRVAFDEMLARQKELGVVTEKQADAAAKFKLAQAELGVVLQTVAREITTSILPPITWLYQHVEKFIDFLRSHENFTKAFFIGLAAILVDVLVPALIAVGVAALPIIAIPLLIGAALAGIALIADDVMAFMNGQNSVIGEVVKKWPLLGEAVHGAVDLIVASLKLANSAVKDSFEYFMNFSAFLADVFTMGPTKALEKFSKANATLWKDIKQQVLGVKDAVVENAKVLTPIVTGVVGGKNTETGNTIANKLVKMGWSPQQAAGIAGSFLQESTGSANAENPTSHAYGLGQWLGSRVRDFEKFTGKPLRGSTLDEQLAFFNYEVRQGKEQSAGKKLMAATTPEEAALAHSKYYERPGTGEANNERRQKLAASIWAEQIRANVATAQTTLGGTNAPVFAQGSGTISNNVKGNSTTTVDVGGVTVTSASTDPASVARDVSKTLAQHITSAINHHDDGVAG